MARGRYITDFERDVMRVGVSNGRTVKEIAEFLGRSRMVVYNQINAMREEGTIGNLPLPFVADEIGGAINGGE